jgi:hypothetical protein
LLTLPVEHFRLVVSAFPFEPTVECIARYHRAI